MDYFIEIFYVAGMIMLSRFIIQFWRNHMPIQLETVHIFICSTFRDMHAERDYLVKQVFPELREWYEQRKLHMVDIDLRWGVIENDTEGKNTIKVYLERINECRPFFICFLGQRRGWVPPKEAISDDTYQQYPLLNEKYAGESSTTELEIIHALMDPLHRSLTGNLKKPADNFIPTKYPFFYLRENAYLKSMTETNPDLFAIYTNEGR